MTDNASAAPSLPSHRRARRLRLAGSAVLALGIAAAALIFWLGLREADLNNDPAMQGFHRAEQRQMGQLFGKSGRLMDEWTDDLKQPGTQAILVAGFSALIFAGCFYFARLLDYDDQGE